ncbi:MAG: hypothetical protein V3V72_03980 [Ignavibacteriaceae bacterium]
MDLVKQYIIQSLTAASNNLRLNSQQIEVVALLREAIQNSDDVANDIWEMKKITQLSTFAIRLNEIYNFLTQGKVDFFKISEKFKEHSQYLVRDLNHLLETVNPGSFKTALKVLKGETEEKEQEGKEIDVDLSRREADPEDLVIKESEALKAEFIMEDDNDEDEAYHNFEQIILEPIKSVDTLLKNITLKKINNVEIIKYANVMSRNASLSEKIGFDIIANMHSTISMALQFIKAGNLQPSTNVIEEMRACLIVIVAIIKGKEVDITNYLKKAEGFGKKIQLISKEGVI